VLDLAVKGNSVGLLFGFLLAHGPDYTWALVIVIRYSQTTAQFPKFIR
jgi:hypothetical protein